MKKIKLNHILIAGLILLIVSCGRDETPIREINTNVTENAVTINEVQKKNLGIETGTLEKKTIAYVLKVNGKIDVPPQNMVSVSAQLGGYLKSTQLLPGMKVKKGEVIASMEDQQYIQLQQDYLTSKAKLSYSENEYLRQKELNQSKASSDKMFQQTEADYLSQKIAVKSLSEKLKLINIVPENLSENTLSRSVNIYAPIDGYVSKVNVNIGKYVNPADVLFELVNPSDIHLALTIFEKDVPKLFIGQKLKACTNYHPEIKHNCEIILIGRNLSPERTVEVHCHFDDYDKSLIPGMYMNAEIDVKTNEAFVLPEESIVNFENKHFVFIEEANTYKLCPVQPGYTENGYSEITNPGKLTKQKIVIKGAYSLLMALKNKSE
jgi:cobalt-zinc-cadmium efflux system membrane fusion protein